MARTQTVSTTHPIYRCTVGQPGLSCRRTVSPLSPLSFRRRFLFCMTHPPPCDVCSHRGTPCVSPHKWLEELLSTPALASKNCGYVFLTVEQKVVRTKKFLRQEDVPNR